MEQLARAARDANHEALLQVHEPPAARLMNTQWQLIARGVDLKTYLPLEWDLPAVATGTLRVAHVAPLATLQPSAEQTGQAEFTALHLLAAKGGFASECIRTALRLPKYLNVWLSLS